METTDFDTDFIGITIIRTPTKDAFIVVFVKIHNSNMLRFSFGAKAAFHLCQELVTKWALIIQDLGT